MSSYTNADQILGFAFGEVLPEHACVLTDIFVRTQRGQCHVEGRRGAILIHRAILETLLENQPEVLRALEEVGAVHDVIAPSRVPLPSWDSGPTIQSIDGALYLCEAIGLTQALPELGAVAATLTVTQLGHRDAPRNEGDYVIPRAVMLGLWAAIPHVLAKIDQAESGAASAGS